MSLRVLVHLVDSINGIFIYNRFQADENLLYTWIFPLAGPLVGALILYILWRKTDWLVRILAGNINENELVISTSNLDLIRVTMGILGIYLLITSIPDLIGISAYHIFITNNLSDRNWFTEDKALLIERLVTTICSILIGIWLVSGLRGIKGIIKGINNFWNKAKITNDGEKEE